MSENSGPGAALSQAAPKTEPYVKMPVEFLKREGDSLGAKVLYGIMLAYVGADRHRPCRPGQERLAAEMGVSPKTVRKRLDELKDLHLYTIRPDTEPLAKRGK